MIVPALARWVASVLAADVTGVNALRTTVPKAYPAEADPPACEVLNAHDAADVARVLRAGQATPDLWRLVVRLGQEVSAAGEPIAEDGDDDTVTVILELEAVAAEGDTAELLTLAGRVLRCVRRSLHHAFAPIAHDGFELEGARFTPPQRIVAQFDYPDAGTGRLSVVAELPFTMTDYWALEPIEEP